MAATQYITELRKGSKFEVCPSCGKREFKPEIYIATGELVADNVGRCNRESNCGYHYPAAKYFKDGGKVATNATVNREIKPVAFDYIPNKYLSDALERNEPHSLKTFLVAKFGAEVEKQAANLYKYTGIEKPWPGSTCFWYIDAQGRVTRGTIVAYNPETGKRIKYATGERAGQGKISSFVKAAKLIGVGEGWNYKQTLYGEHLLKQYPNKPVGLVESEKTAIIASLYFPQLVWLATGGKSKLTAERVQVLKGRKVVAFPDLDGFDKWQQAAKDVAHVVNISVSTYLNDNATEADKAAKLDLADYLLKFDLSEFIKPSEPKQPVKTEPATVLQNVEPTPEPEPQQPAFSMATAFTQVKRFFDGVNLDGLQSIRLNNYSFIENPALFVRSHLSVIERNLRNKRFQPYLNRLEIFKQTLQTI